MLAHLAAITEPKSKYTTPQNRKPMLKLIYEKKNRIEKTVIKRQKIEIRITIRLRLVSPPFSSPTSGDLTSRHGSAEHGVRMSRVLMPRVVETKTASVESSRTPISDRIPRRGCGCAPETRINKFSPINIEIVFCCRIVVSSPTGQLHA